ncbi:MAG: helix-turn-helix domain-containing protein [Isosphaeraceae bacterium]|nr:helix-turn-helix domain-containing protein [Isosphaeraceae bacterium]
MATQTKVYRFWIKPTADQEAALNRMAGARRWVWNWALARKREYYQATGKTLTFRALGLELTALKSRPEPLGSRISMPKRCSRPSATWNGPSSTSLSVAPDSLASRRRNGTRLGSVSPSGSSSPAGC